VVEPSKPEAVLIDAAGSALGAARARLAAAEAARSSDRHALRTAAMATFSRARAAATDAAAVTGELAPLAADVPLPAKRAALVGLCADGATTVVCCDSAVAAAAAAAHLEAAGVTVGLLTSDTPRARQGELAAALGGTVQVLVTARVGQLGWNLQAATRIVHYDVPLTAAEARQREGRARRIGGGHVDVVCLALAGGVDADAAAAWARSGTESGTL
jgi:superfamily II DNA/RNA helicase